MGHVPPGAVPAEGSGDELPRREHRGARAEHLSVTDTARLGEDLAARFLQRRGAKVLGRNLRVGRGELDLVVEMAGERVAVEVKTRRSGDGRGSFTRDKEAAVRAAARGLRPPVYRLDLISITLGRDACEIRWLPRV